MSKKVLKRHRKQKRQLEMTVKYATTPRNDVIDLLLDAEANVEELKDLLEKTINESRLLDEANKQLTQSKKDMIGELTRAKLGYERLSRRCQHLADMVSSFEGDMLAIAHDTTVFLYEARKLTEQELTTRDLTLSFEFPRIAGLKPAPIVALPAPAN